MEVMSSLLLRRVRVVPLDGPAAIDPVDVLISEDGVITEVAAVARPRGVPEVHMSIPEARNEPAAIAVHHGHPARPGHGGDLGDDAVF